MSNRLHEIEALGQSIWIDNLNRELLDDGTLEPPDRGRRPHRRDLQPHDLREGNGRTPTATTTPSARWPRETDDPQEIFERLALARRPRRRRPAAPGVRAHRGPGRLRVVRAARRRWPSTPRARSSRRCACRELIDRRERAHQGARHRAEGVRGLRGADRPRRERERDAAVRRRALRARSPRPTCAASSGGWRPASRGPRRVGGQLLRLARGHQGGRRAGGARPRGPARQGRRGQRARSPTPTSRRSSRASAGSAWRRPARTCSARCGPPPRPRTPTTRTRCTSTS